MPAAIWSGTISFGLVSVPVQLYPVSRDTGPTLHTVHAEDGGRIRQRRVCELDRAEVPLTDIARGYPAGHDVVVVTDRDLDQLPAVARHVIAIEAVVPEDQVDLIAYRRSYYTAPQQAGLRPYILLRDALARSRRLAVVRYAMRERESLAVLRAREDVIVLETLWWDDEIRTAPATPAPVDDPEQQAVMRDLIDAMTDDFRPEQYQNRYAAALQDLIDAKAAGRAVAPAQPAPDTSARIGDLMTALRASVEAARRTRGPDEKPTRKRPGKAA
ncbi:MAG: Ku protein [Catenulispora sp. 13_1_20CM_3_70_7]|nr:MAG: Ku protein [Catenulispora sp. 13_1_20CM_3_70_7]